MKSADSNSLLCNMVHQMWTPMRWCSLSITINACTLNGTFQSMGTIKCVTPWKVVDMKYVIPCTMNPPSATVIEVFYKVPLKYTIERATLDTAK